MTVFLSVALVNNRKLKSEINQIKDEQTVNSFFEFCDECNSFDECLRSLSNGDDVQKNIHLLSFYAKNASDSFSRLPKEEGMGHRVPLFINRCAEYSEYLYSKNSPNIAVSNLEDENFASLSSCSEKMMSSLNEMKNSVLSKGDISLQASVVEKMFSLDGYKRSAKSKETLSICELEKSALDVPGLYYDGALSNSKGYIKREYTAEQGCVEEDVIFEKTRIVLGKPFKFSKRTYNMPSLMGVYGYNNKNTYCMYTENGGCLINSGKYFSSCEDRVLDDEILISSAVDYMAQNGYNGLKFCSEKTFSNVKYMSFCDNEKEKITVGTRVSDGEVVFFDSGQYLKEKISVT